jgi:hypothetical protein
MRVLCAAGARQRGSARGAALASAATYQTSLDLWLWLYAQRMRMNDRPTHESKQVRRAHGATAVKKAHAYPPGNFDSHTRKLVHQGAAGAACVTQQRNMYTKELDCERLRRSKQEYELHLRCRRTHQVRRSMLTGLKSVGARHIMQNVPASEWSSYQGSSSTN